MNPWFVIAVYDTIATRTAAEGLVNDLLAAHPGIVPFQQQANFRGLLLDLNGMIEYTQLDDHEGAVGPGLSTCYTSPDADWVTAQQVWQQVYNMALAADNGN